MHILNFIKYFPSSPIYLDVALHTVWLCLNTTDASTCQNNSLWSLQKFKEIGTMVAFETHVLERREN